FRRGFQRGITGIRIDRTLTERMGFGLGRGLLMPVMQLGRLAGVATLATTALGPLAGAMAGVGGAAVGLGTGLAQASGALALIPALAAGAAAGIATVVVGCLGVVIGGGGWCCCGYCRLGFWVPGCRHGADCFAP